MAITISPEKMLNILGSMIVAVNNIRLYPPGSGLISNSLEKAFASFQSIITDDEPLLIAESEGNIMISGEPIDFRSQQPLQVTTLRNSMATLGIRSILLKKDMTIKEFRSLLTILGRTTEEAEAEGGLQKMVSTASFKNITVTQSVFVGDQGTAKIRKIDFADLDLVKALTGERPIRETDYLRIGKNIYDSRWVSDFFNAAIIQLENQGITIEDSIYPDLISRIVQAFARSTPRENWGRVSASISKTIGQTEKQLLAHVMVKNVDEQLFDTMIASLSDEEFVDLIAEVDFIRENHIYGEKNLKEEDLEKVVKTLDTLKNNKKTERLHGEIKKKITDRKKEVAKAKAKNIQDISRIIKGDLTPLEDQVFLESIPESVRRFHNEGKELMVSRLIEKIANGLMSENPKDRAVSSSALLAISNTLMDEGNDKELQMIIDRLNIWLKFETEPTFNYKSVCQMFQKHTKNLLRQQKYTEANSLLETFSFIFTGKISKNDEIKEIAGNVLKNIANDEIFKIIFEEFIENSKGKGQEAYYTLIRFGEIAVVPLLDHLKESDQMSQRVRAINILSEIGATALPYVIERIQAGCPWYYMRNLIKLLSDLGSTEHLEILRPLLKYDHDKIQIQVLHCAFDIGGDQRLKFFTQALNHEEHDVRITAVDLIGKLENEEGVFPLSQLIKSESRGGSSDQKNELNLAICTAFKRIGSKKAISTLRLIETQKGILGISVYSPELRQAAAATIKHLQELPAKETPEPQTRGAKTDSFSTVDHLREDPAQLEAIVDEYIKQKNIKGAVNLLYKMTIRFAREKNFVKAEQLREKLFNVDPMALGEIVKTGDIIEEEKKNLVLNDYATIWANLYNTLEQEEANSLFYSVKPMEFPADHALVVQGRKNSSLYFINRGQIKVVYAQGDKETFLKMLGSGDIAGDDTFFSISVSTVSIITMNQVKAGCLDYDTLKHLEEKHPGIEEKLRHFCKIGGGINDLVVKKGLERRQQTRVNLVGKTMVQLLDLKGTPIGKPFNGTILDLSTGGIAFTIRTRGWHSTRMLLGRKLQMTISINTATAPIEIDGLGTIISIRERKNSRFSLHLKFDNQINENNMLAIVSQSITT